MRKMVKICYVYVCAAQLIKKPQLSFQCHDRVTCSIRVVFLEAPAQSVTLD